MENTIEVNKKSLNKVNLIKFILASLFGSIMFLIPVPYKDSFSTVLGIISDFLGKQLGGILPYIVVAIVVVSAVLSVITYFFKPKMILENNMLKSISDTSPLYIVSRVVAAIFALLIIFKAGPEVIISGATGGTMMSLSASLLTIVIIMSYILPFLTDCGIMEFMGIILKKVVRPLFTVPGRASIDLITSWLGASNAAVILTKGQYMSGFYSTREAAVIMTNFSIVSIPFCLIIAGILGIENLFPAFYLTICIVGLVLAIIIPRIRPLSQIPDEFNQKTGKLINEQVPEGHSTFSWALDQSCKRAEVFTLKKVTQSGNDVFLNFIFTLIPIVIAWGTLGLIVVEYTPIFNWISYPLGYYLQILGVDYAFEVAPATLVGFADMFIPALLVAGVESVKTKFVIGVLSLVQIIYMTEVGAIIVQSDVPLNLKQLFIIFLQRTIIALPIIVLLANIFIK